VKAIWAVALKEIRQAMRDPLALVVLVGLPVFLLILLGYAISFDVEHVALAVQDRDMSAASREVIRAFTSSGKFDLERSLPAATDLDRYLESGAVQAILVIAEGFGSRLAGGETAPLQLLLDGTDATTASTIQGYAAAISSAVGVELVARQVALATGQQPRFPGIEYRPRVWYNPELESSHFLVPGLIAFIMMLSGVLSTALSLVREKERGTLEQLRVAPLRTVQLLLGKTLPYLAFSLLAVALILFAARLMFGLVVKGPLLDLFLATLLFLLGSLGWGLLVSTLADTQAAAFQFGIFSALLPTLILSGFVFPIRNMPLVLQGLSYIVPARYFLVILRGIALKGTTLAPYWDQMGYLALYTLAVLMLAGLRFARGSQ